MADKFFIPNRGFLRLPTILKLIPVGKSTWWAGVKTGRFPKSVKLGKRITAWRADEIHALIQSLNGSQPDPVSSPDVLEHSGAIKRESQ